jgi:hypothetical protein
VIETAEIGEGECDRAKGQRTAVGVARGTPHAGPIQRLGVRGKERRGPVGSL